MPSVWNILHLFIHKELLSWGNEAASDNQSPRLLDGPTIVWPMTVFGVRHDKAALFQWVQAPPGKRSSRKQPEQSWR